jgi:hypothetical protein
MPRLFLILALVLMSRIHVSSAETYRIGPQETHRTISEIADRLRPGDVVEVTGDIVDSFLLSKDGTPSSPITVRGVTRTTDGRLVRPKITFDRTVTRRISCTGNWNVIEGLDISGATGDRAKGGTAIHALCGGLIVRNCRIHHCSQGIYAKMENARAITIEFCEFDSIGIGSIGPCVYLETPNPGSVATIEHCYFHDGLGGPLVVTSYPRNVIRYNWFENTFAASVKVLSEDTSANAELRPKEGLRPMHSDIVGNVFAQGWTPGSRYCVLQLGGAGESNPGTEGDFNIAHNLFVMSVYGSKENPPVVCLVQGNVDRVMMCSNTILRMGGSRCLVYLRDVTWDTP